MSGLPLQILGMTLLAATSAALWAHAARRGASPQTNAQRLQLALALLGIGGGFWGGAAWWFDNPDSFAWDLPPLASRMLAAASWAFTAAGLVALGKPDASHMQQFSRMIAVYLAPLALAIMLMHRDRFDFAAPVTFVFFLIVAPMTAASLYFSMRPEGLIAASGAEQPPSPVLRLLLTAVTAICGVWGLAIFLIADGPLPALWFWPADLLTSRLIGVMLLTLSATAWFARQSEPVARMNLIFQAVYGAGVVTAGFVNLAFGRPVPLAYVAAFGVLAAASLAALARGKA